MSKSQTKQKSGKKSKQDDYESEPDIYAEPRGTRAPLFGEADEDPLLDDSYDANPIDIDEIDNILSKPNQKQQDKQKKEQEKKLSEDLKRKKLEEKLAKEDTKAAKENDKDPQERAVLMLMIEKRKALFPHQSSSLNVTNSMTNEEIRNKIHEVDIRISNKNAMSITKHAIDAIASGTEKFGPTVGYDFHGLAAYVNEDPLMTDLVNEMSLKYDSYKQFPVELRFMMSFTGGALAIHRANTSKKVTQIVTNLNQSNVSDL